MTDLEGVLIPEIWVEIAEKTGIRELRQTTHDVADFEALMAIRIQALTRNHLRLSDIVRIAENVMPFPGSIEYLSWLRKRGPILILSDTFTELADDIVTRLGGYPLFSNRFKVNSRGHIVGYQLRIRGRKDAIVTALRDIGYTLVAVGDGFNDLSMLHTSHYPILFNPARGLVRHLKGHQPPIVRNFVQLKSEMERIIETVQEPGLD